MTQQITDPISCAEFQEHLPELFTNANGIPDDLALQAHLDTCDNCSTLVRDLQYIADQARMLLEPAEEEPSDAVWVGLKDKLAAERAESISTPPPLLS
jgi:hypothetical protein